MTGKEVGIAIDARRQARKVALHHEQKYLKELRTLSVEPAVLESIDKELAWLDNELRTLP